MIFSIVLLLVVAFLGMILLSTLIGGGAALGGPAHVRGLEEVLLQDNRSMHKIAVVDVEGIISSTPLGGSGLNLAELIRFQLERAAEDDRVKAVVMRVDSPGGEVLPSDIIYREVKEFQENHGKPVIASMGGLAASGGYYVSAPCQWIVANQLTITGSIGVIMQSLNYRGLLDKVGIQPMIFKSGEFKDMLSGMKNPEEMQPAEMEMIQSMVDETHQRFKEVVEEGRSFSLKNNQNQGRQLVENWEEYADGRILTGSQAYEFGFVDELGDFETAVKRAELLSGIPDSNLVQFRQPIDFRNLFRLFGSTEEAKTVKVDLGLDLPKLEAGRLYYLSNTLFY